MFKPFTPPWARLPTSMLPPHPHLWTGEFPAPEAQRIGWVHMKAIGGPTATGPSFQPTPAPRPCPQTPNTCKDTGVQGWEWDGGLAPRVQARVRKGAVPGSGCAAQ